MTNISYPIYRSEDGEIKVDGGIKEHTPWAFSSEISVTIGDNYKKTIKTSPTLDYILRGLRERIESIVYRYAHSDRPPSSNQSKYLRTLLALPLSLAPSVTEYISANEEPIERLLSGEAVAEVEPIIAIPLILQFRFGDSLRDISNHFYGALIEPTQMALGPDVSIRTKLYNSPLAALSGLVTTLLDMEQRPQNPVQKHVARMIIGYDGWIKPKPMQKVIYL